MLVVFIVITIIALVSFFSWRYINSYNKVVHRMNNKLELETYHNKLENSLEDPYKNPIHYPIYYINLDRSPERNLNMIKQLPNSFSKARHA